MLPVVKFDYIFQLNEIGSVKLKLMLKLYSKDYLETKKKINLSFQPLSTGRKKKNHLKMLEFKREDAHSVRLACNTLAFVKRMLCALPMGNQRKTKQK